MRKDHDDGRRLYKARRPDGEVAWVDHDELWRLQRSQADRLRRARSRRRRSILLALVGLVALSLALVVLRLRSPFRSPPQPSAEVSRPAVAAAGSGAEAEQPVGAVEPALSPNERVAGAVHGWADAWARQDVSAYLASYGSDFESVGGRSRTGWRSWRRQRLLAPAAIRVEIEELEIAFPGAGRAEARFVQSYRSPDYADVVHKTLQLVEEGGQWRIVSERAESP